jgi:hypothetical protein
MLVSLRLSSWAARYIDVPTTKEVLKQKGADQGSGRFEKYLIPKEALAEVEHAKNSARHRFRSITLPWDEGTGIISSERWQYFQEQMHELRQALERAADKFCAAYPTLRADAARRMGDLYDDADFPTADSIRARFGFEVTVLPIPDKADFRLDLGDETVAHIRQGIERHVTERFQAAQRELWQRVLDVVKHFAGVMRDNDAKFKDVTVTRLATIADEAASLSVLPDPELDKACAEIRRLARGVNADTLRVDAAARMKAATDAEAAVKRIERTMAGAF